MFRVILSVLINMFLGAMLSMLIIRMPEKAPLLIIAVFFLAILITALIMMVSNKKEEIKRAEDELEEGEVHYLLMAYSARVAETTGMLTLVQSNKNKKLKLLIFPDTPPPIFKLEGGKIVPHS